MRVIHIVEPTGAGDAPLIACRAALGAERAEHEVWIIGGTADEARASALGLPCDHRIPAPLGRTRLAARRLAAHARALAQRRLASPLIVQCWSPGALAAAHPLRGQADAVALAAARGPGGQAPSRIVPGVVPDTQLPPFRPRLVTAIGIAAAGQWRSAGYRTAQTPLPIDPAPEPIDPARRASLRRSLGIRDSDAAILMLADPPGRGDAQRMAIITGLTHVVAAGVTGVLPVGAAADRRAARYVQALGRRWGFVRTCLSVEDAAAVCDVGLCDGAGWNAGTGLSPDCACSALTLAAACARGLPIVAVKTPETLEVLGDSWPYLAREPTSVQLTSNLLDLITDSMRRRSASDEALSRARSVCDARAYRETLTRLWQRLCGEVLVSA